MNFICILGTYLHAKTKLTKSKTKRFTVKNVLMAYLGDLVEQLSKGLLWSVYFFTRSWAETKPFLCRPLKSHPIIIPYWLLED